MVVGEQQRAATAHSQEWLCHVLRAARDEVLIPGGTMPITRWIYSMRMWVRALFGREAADRELDDELRFHVESATEANIAKGMPPAEARRAALIEAGGLDQAKEKCRDARGVRRIQDLAQDLRFGLRMLRKNPAFTAIAIMTLALGIAATTVMFTLVNGVLLKPLTYPQADRLVTLHEQTEKYGDNWGFSYLDFLDIDHETRSMAATAAWRYDGGTIGERGDAEYVDGRQISSDLFSVLGVTLAQGRPFQTDEDRSGGTPAIIISYGLWQRRYGGKAAAIGTSLVFGGKSYTVVGVVPAGFQLSGEQPDIYTPLGQSNEPRMQNRAARFLHVVARLRSGLTLSQTQAELTLIGRALADEYPKYDAGQAIVAQPLREELVGDVRPTLWLLLGAVSLVLLIACANIASLLLCRWVSRQRELAVRRALGASRLRLVRQCLTESGILAFCGGALGLLVAPVGTRLFVSLWPGSLPRVNNVQIDWRVPVFALTLSILSAFVFGLAPALTLPEGELEQVLREEGRTTKRESRRLHGRFAAAQVALALVLLFSAGTLGHALLRLSSLNPGFNAGHVLAARALLAPHSFSSPAEARAAWQDLLGHARFVPGVRTAALADIIPMRAGENSLPYSTTSALPPVDQMPVALATSITPDYLDVMGIRLREGRFFTDDDRIGSEPVVLIDDVLAQHAFGSKDPVGQPLWIPAMGAIPVRIVGVVGHVRHWGLADDDQSLIRNQIYYPFAQVPDSLMGTFSSFMSIVVRTDVPPLNVVEPLEREARKSTGSETLYEIRTMEQLASASLSRQRFLLVLFTAFGGLALLLAGLGIYGVLSYLTNQRVREIGVRMALGASASNVMWLVLRQSLGMIVAGVATGVVAALSAGYLLAHFVAGVRRIDPAALIIVISALVLAALWASYIPARRAMKVDPMVALRHE